MYIQPVNMLNKTYKNVSKSNQVRKNNSNIAFKSYEQSFRNMVTKEFTDIYDISTSFYMVLEELEKIGKIISPKVLELIKSQRYISLSYITYHLCKPLDDMLPEFKKIVNDTKEYDLPIIDAGDRGSLVIRNLGTHGFFNSIFNPEKARNDMWLILYGDHGMIEIGRNPSRDITIKQTHYSKWYETSFSGYLSDKITVKSGTIEGYTL